jgi:hypothetical protein
VQELGPAQRLAHPEAADRQRPLPPLAERGALDHPVVGRATVPARDAQHIRRDPAPGEPIEEGAKSVLLGHLGNIAQTTGRALRIDATTGHITGDDEAMKSWAREYAPGWAPVV